MFPSKEIMPILLARDIKYVLIHRDVFLPEDLEVHDQRIKMCTSVCDNFIFLDSIGNVDVYMIKFEENKR